MDISTIKPIDKVITQLRKLHLFNICSKEKIYPQTYAKGVTVINANGEEQDLQSYLESTDVSVGQQVQEDITELKSNMDELKNGIDSLKADMQKFGIVIKDVMDCEEPGRVVLVGENQEVGIGTLTTDATLKYTYDEQNKASLKMKGIDADELSLADKFYEK